MLKKGILYTFIVVGVYIAVAHATDAGRLLTATAGGYATAVKALQGRG